MSSPANLASEKDNLPNSAPTSATHPLTSPWRRREVFPSLTPITPRHLRDSSWRHREATATSSSSTIDYHASPSSNTTTSNSPYQFSPSKVGSKEPTQLPSTPAIGANMPSLPRESYTRHNFDGPTLMAVAMPNCADARPRLQLQIPGGSTSGEQMPIPPSIVQTNSPALYNRAAEVYGLSTLPPISRRKRNVHNRQSLFESSDATMRLPDAFRVNLTNSVNQQHSQPTGGPFPANRIDETDRSPRANEVAQRGAIQYTESPEIATFSSGLENAFYTGTASHTGNTDEMRGSWEANFPSTAGQVSRIDDSNLIGRAAGTDNLNQPDPRSPASSPKFMACNQPSSTHSARAGGHPRRVVPHHPRETTHSNSRTWINPRTQLQAKWTEVYKSLKEMSFIRESPPSLVRPPFAIDGSFCVPKTLCEWVDHRTSFANDRAEEAKQRLWAMQEHKLNPRHPNLPPAGEIAPITILPFGGRRFKDGLAPVLAMSTIWSPWKTSRREDQIPREEERPQALWPTPEEMREEGNERNTSHFSRFLALPRVPGNPTVVWKQKKLLLMLPFDEIWKLPNKETYHDQRRVASLEEKAEMETMIGKDLLAAIDFDRYQEER